MKHRKQSKSSYEARIDLVEGDINALPTRCFERAQIKEGMDVIHGNPMSPAADTEVEWTY